MIWLCLLAKSGKLHPLNLSTVTAYARPVQCQHQLLFEHRWERSRIHPHTDGKLQAINLLLKDKEFICPRDDEPTDLLASAKWLDPETFLQAVLKGLSGIYLCAKCSFVFITPMIKEEKIRNYREVEVGGDYRSKKARMEEEEEAIKYSITFLFVCLKERCTHRHKDVTSACSLGIMESMMGKSRGSSESDIGHRVLWPHIGKGMEQSSSQDLTALGKCSDSSTSSHQHSTST